MRPFVRIVINGWNRHVAILRANIVDADRADRWSFETRN
jgi:hypothetical protein